MSDSSTQWRAILDARARELARPPVAVATGTTEMLVFRLAGERCAMPAHLLHDVARAGSITPLPGATEPMTAVAAWRGALLPVVNLRFLLGMPRATAGEEGRLLVIGRESARCGLLVDDVEDIHPFHLASIRLPADGVAPNRDYVDGVGEGAVMMISAERLLGLEL
jgi:purine-binding chemotaxis protein CheW